MNCQGYAAWLWGRLRPYRKRLFLGLTTAIMAGLVGTVDPLLMRHWLDVTLPQRRLLGSLVTVLLIALCFVGRSGLAGLAGLVSFRITQLLAQDLKVELLAHMTSLSADWHERTSLGEKLSRIGQDVEQIAQFGADVLGTVLRAGIFFAINLAIMLTLNWRMTLTILPLLPLFLWVRGRFRSIIQIRADRAQFEVGRASGNVTEHLAAVPQIQILCAEEARMSYTVGAWVEQLGAQWAQRRTEIAFSVTITSVLALAILFVLGLGTHEYLVGLLSLGSLVAFYAYVTRIFEPVSTAMELYSRSQRMLASARRVRDVLETRPSVADTGHVETIPSPLVLGLSCESVSFAYAAEHHVLENLTVQIGSRDRVALIGRSGSGKSTLARLLARVADPNSGRVMLEGKSASEYTLRTLRQTICYVPQEPILFSATIRENLLYANRSASAAEIDGAIDAAQLQPVLSRLPRGLDTVLGPDGSGLSGGERQRLALARALLRRSALLILDESTSALDLATEQAVLQSIATLRKDLALVVISHRLRSLTWVDRIILLNSGRIVAQGTHSNLYDKCALYRGLYEKDEVIDERRSRPQASTTRQSRLSLPA
jgi:ABC-type multidrug transport system fused ATPase/permease subunit